MQVTYPDAFALKNSGLGTFLYAEVGAELNGSMLTVFSLLARLDRDPWAEAARWAALPRTDAVDSLSDGIGNMPLAEFALAERRLTAARLLQLLPATVQLLWPGTAASAGAAPALRWTLTAALCCALALAVALNVVLAWK